MICTSITFSNVLPLHRGNWLQGFDDQVDVVLGNFRVRSSKRRQNEAELPIVLVKYSLRDRPFRGIAKLKRAVAAEFQQENASSIGWLEIEPEFQLPSQESVQTNRIAHRTQRRELRRRRSVHSRIQRVV